MKIKKILLFFVLCYCSAVGTFAQSKAHDDSKFAIIDPAYNSKSLFPQSNVKIKATSWIYGASELECWRLELLQQRKDSAKLKVGYPGVFHKPYKEVSFRLLLKNPQTLKSIEFKAVGHGKLYINDTLVGDFTENNSIHTFTFKKNLKVQQIQFDISSLNDLPALLVESRSISTTSNNWEWKPLCNNWDMVSHFPQNMQNLPPHRLEDPTIRLKPKVAKNNLYDFGCEIFGYIFIRSEMEPIIGAGESEPEALNMNRKFHEQSLEFVNISKGLWKVKYPVAFRYVFLENSQLNSIWCEAIFHPETYKGAFACSDSIITRIWMNSAYTLRLCMHDFLLDGIKRDRLPWAGDLAMSSLVNAFTFSDQELVRRSLVVLGREGIKEKDINGIVDFSLWWIITQDQYQLYFGDSTHLIHEWIRIKETMNILLGTCDTTGYLVPRKGARLFLDWVDQEKWTSLQILWWWAQNSYVKLAQRVGDTETANYWNNNASKLKKKLLKTIWSDKEQYWLSKNDTLSEKTRHPNFLAVVSGLADQNQYSSIKTFLQDNRVKPVGTPYMAGYEVMALSRLGDVDYMLKRVKDFWGEMLNKGATTFWEAYNASDSRDRQYSFYNRPYGKSLCHAWSSGPAAFLSSELFGLQPIEDGWKRFTIHPNIGSLQWANICLPTKYGSIMVNIEKNTIQITIPKGTTFEWKGNSVVGPRILSDKL